MLHLIAPTGSLCVALHVCCVVLLTGATTLVEQTKLSGSRNEKKSSVSNVYADCGAAAY
jgi:hypothetical protein